jgi:hypothetical protein
LSNFNSGPIDAADDESKAFLVELQKLSAQSGATA